MANAAFILFAEQSRWRVGVVSSKGVSLLEIDGDASAAASVFWEKGYAGQGVVLALPSKWCLAAEISTRGVAKSARRQMMAFRLEEKLPLPAEEFVADFVEWNEQALGVCAALATLRPLVDALEAAGVVVQAVCPVALLATQDQLPAVTNGEVLLWAEGEQISIIVLAGLTPQAWYLAPATPRDLLQHLSVVAIRNQGNVRVRAFGLENAEVIESIRTSPRVESFVSNAHDLTESASRASAAILAGQKQALINLRQGAMASEHRYRQIARPLNLAAVAGIVSLLCVCAALLWRAHRYDVLASAAEREAVGVFQEMLPNQTPPSGPNVRRRLDSEERMLRGLSDASTPVVAGESALVLLRDALVSLPTNIRFGLSEIRVGDQKLYLEGVTDTHPDAEAIARGLRDSGKFSLPDPKSEQLADQTVSFVINASAKSPTLVEAPR